MVCVSANMRRVFLRSLGNTFVYSEGNINFTRGCLVRFVTGPLSHCRSLAVENCINNCVFSKRIWRVCPKNTYVYLESSHNIQVATANLWSFQSMRGDFKIARSLVIHHSHTNRRNKTRGSPHHYSTQSYAHRKLQAFKATTKQLKRLLHRSIFKLDLFLDSRQKFSYKSLVTFLDAE